MSRTRRALPIESAVTATAAPIEQRVDDRICKVTVQDDVVVADGHVGKRDVIELPRHVRHLRRGQFDTVSRWSDRGEHRSVRTRRGDDDQVA